MAALVIVLTAAPSLARADNQTLSDAQLEQLVAPVALYPDPLLAQTLTASTYPLEIVKAARWVAENPDVKGDALESAMQQQTWDPSVKALTAVPQVLQMMSDKIDWTQQLGEAFLAQPDELTTAIQTLRAKAADNGSLKTTTGERVTRVPAPPPPGPPPAVEPTYIAIEPIDPDEVYVPVYDPSVVYGPWPYPDYPPYYWYPPGFVVGGAIFFGTAFFVGPALWCHYDWFGRRVNINVALYNRFNHTQLANTAANQAWHHDPAHRGNVGYHNARLQQQFGHAAGLSQGPRNLPGANPVHTGGQPVHAGGQKAFQATGGPKNFSAARGTGNIQRFNTGRVGGAGGGQNKLTTSHPPTFNANHHATVSHINHPVPPNRVVSNNRGNFNHKPPGGGHPGGAPHFTAGHAPAGNVHRH